MIPAHAEAEKNTKNAVASRRKPAPCGLKNKNAPAMLQNMICLRPSWEVFGRYRSASHRGSHA
jgi:hypothetical protein